MELWQETERILDVLLRLAAEGRAVALARVVAIDGSAYRRPGAALLVAEDAPAVGGVSGGCLEEDVRLVGLEVARTLAPRLRRYDTKDDDSRPLGLGLGCGGSVEIFVQPVSTDEERRAWSVVRERLRGDESFAVVTALEGPRAGKTLVAGNGWATGSLGDPRLDDGARAAALGAIGKRASSVQVVGGVPLFIEALLPPPRLLVCGAGDDAIPLVALAASVGFRVLVADHREAYVTDARFPDARALFLQRPEAGVPAALPGPGAFAIVKCHSLGLDRGWVRALLGADVGYVGVLGPRERTRRIADEIEAAGRDRLYGPVGLDLGAEGPEQVALAIVAELLAVRSARTPAHLREKESAVHA